MTEITFVRAFVNLHDLCHTSRECFRADTAGYLFKKKGEIKMDILTSNQMFAFV